MRALATHLLHFGAAESCGKCFPCRIGLRRAHEMFAGGAPVDRDAARGAARDARARLAVRPRRRDARTDPQPAGTLSRRSSDSHDVIRSRSTAPRPRSRPARPCSRPSARLGGASRRSASTSARSRSAPAASAWSASRALPGPVAACTTPCRDGMVIDTRDPTARRIAAATVELVLSELPAAPGAAHRARRSSPRALGVDARRAALARRRSTRPRHDERHPYLALQHELCISCGRCVRACDEIQGAFALTATGRGFEANIAAGHGPGLPRVDLRVVRRLRRHVPDRRDHRDLPAGAGGEVADDALRPRRHHHLRLLRRRLPAGGARRRRPRRLDQPGARRPREQGPHVPEGPLRARLRAQARAPAHAADPRRARRRAAAPRPGTRRSRASSSRADAHPRRRRARRDRRPRLLARDERGLLRHAAPHARRDRHAQHRQLLARLPLPHVVGAAPVARPVRRDRLVRRHRGRRRGDPHRRQPDRGPPGRRRADQAGDAARPEARHDRPAPDRAVGLRRRCTSARGRARNAAVMLGLAHVVARDGLVDRAFLDDAHRGLRRGRGPARRLHAGRRAAHQRRPGGRPRARRAHLRRGRRGVRCCGASA